MASMYAVYHGPAGLRAIALQVHAHATALADALRAGGLDVTPGPIFDTVRVTVPGRADDVVAAALAAGVNVWPVDDDTVSSLAELDAVLAGLGLDATAIAALRRQGVV